MDAHRRRSKLPFCPLRHNWIRADLEPVSTLDRFDDGERIVHDEIVSTSVAEQLVALIHAQMIGAIVRAYFEVMG